MDYADCSGTATKDGNQMVFKESIQGINEWPHKWADGIVSYRLNNLSPDFRGSHQIRAVTVALRTWQLRINKIKFRRERNPHAHVDFNVTFESSDKFSSPCVFAHAWFPGQGDISGDVEINDEDWDWVPSVHLQDLAHPPLTSVMIHEFGHSLGLRHDPTYAQSIMYPSFNLGRKKILLHDRDIQRIQDKYGRRNLSKRILDYFANRRLNAWDFD